MVCLLSYVLCQTISELVCGALLILLIIASIFMQVQKFTLLDKDFSMPGGELGEFDLYLHKLTSLVVECNLLTSTGM